MRQSEGARKRQREGQQYDGRSVHKLTQMAKGLFLIYASILF